jgi:hypothetical protein
MGGELLGSAVLDLDVDLAPLVRGLDKAERIVAERAAIMQATLDRLRADLDSHLGASEALIGRAPQPRGPDSTPAVENQRASNVTQNDSNQVWGVRGPQKPGSVTNPIVVALEAAKFTTMGSYAAAIGESNMSDTQHGDQSSGVASAVDLAALTATVADLARNLSPGAQLAAAGAQGLAEPALSGQEPQTVVLDDPMLKQTLAQIANALGRQTQASSRTVLVPAQTDTGAPASRQTVLVPTGDGRSTRPTVMDVGGARTVDTTIINSSRTDIIPAAGAGGRAGSGTSQYPVAFSWPGQGGGGGGIVPVPLGAGGGGGGNRFLTIQHLSDPNSGGGGGGTSDSLLTQLGWGKGIAGLAGVGTALSFAGLGFEHLLFTAAGLLGSAGGAAIGGGLKVAGALGPLAVGGGSDALIGASTVADTKTLGTALTAVNTAIVQYGANSKQAAAAQANFNLQEKLLGDTIGVKAEATLAKNAEALDTLFDKESGYQRVLATDIGEQAITAGQTFLPLILSAASRNLAIINDSLKPLFSWLEGPDGIGIFQNLENEFAHNLPFAMSAFDNGIELLLRVVNIASQSTGGFTEHLDDLLTKWNSMDNAQLGVVIDRYISDFRLWDTFVKLLVKDIYGLFHQDVGTGNSIIETLNGMLEKLHAYEQSATGSAELQNIFEVHKTEILELIKVFEDLGTAFGHIYLAVAPQLVTVMNDVVLPALNDVASVVDFIASHSQLAADAMGLWLIKIKGFGLLGGIFSPLTKGLAGVFGGEKAVAAGATLDAAALARATAIGAATAGGATTEEAAAAGGTAAAAAAKGAAGGSLLTRLLRGLSGKGAALTEDSASLDVLGAGGLSTLAGSAGAIAAGAAAALPLVLAGGAGVLVARFITNATGLSLAKTTSTNLNTNKTSTSGAGGYHSAIGGGVGSVIDSIVNFPADLLGLGATNHVLKITGDLAKASAAQLDKLKGELKDVNSVKVDGVGESISALRQEINKLLEPLDAVKKKDDAVFSSLNHWFIDTGRGLGSLEDDFNTHMLKIASGLQTNSTKGRIAVAENVAKLVQAVQKGMGDGTISVTKGMAAINAALKTGMQDGAISWTTAWHSMFNTVTDLYDQHKIDTKQYYADLHSITSQGDARISQDTETSNKAMFNYLKEQQHLGNISQQQFNQKWHEQQVSATAQAKTDMADFAAQIVAGFAQVTSQGGQGLTDMISSVNSALKLLGAAPLTGLQISVLTTGNNPRGTAILPGAASGGIFQVGQPGQAGHDSVPMNVGGQQIVVAPGEQVAVFNRHQLPIVNAALAPMGGLPGLFSQVSTPHYMSTGGYVYPFPPGTTLGRTDQGVDADMPAGAPIGAIGPAQVKGVIPDFYQGQPEIYEQLTAGPMAGRYIYLAEQISNLASGSLTGHSALAHFASSGTGIEMGWATGSGETLARSTTGYVEGQATPAGTEFRDFIMGLAHGIITGGSLGGGASTWTNLAAPIVKGGGPLADIVRGALQMVTKAANKYGQAHAGTPGVGGGAQIGGAGVTSGSWWEVARQLAKRHGWDDAELQAWWGVEQMEDGGLSLTARNASGAYGLAQFINGPGEYAQYGGDSTTIVGQLTAMANYLAQRYGTPVGALAHERSAPGAGYAQGGFLDMLAGGGMPGLGGDQAKHMTSLQHAFVVRNQKASSKKAPKPSKNTGLSGRVGALGSAGVLGQGGPFPFATGDLDPINNALGEILRLDGGGLGTTGTTDDATKVSNLIQWYTNLWGSGLYPSPNFSSWDSPSDFVLTTDAAGNTVNPFISPNINEVVKQLQEVTAYQGEWMNDLTGAQKLSSSIVGPIKAAIARRKAEVAKIRKRIEENLKRIKALQKQVTAEKKKKHPDKSKITGWNKQITSLEAENLKLSGSKTTVGTTGELGQLTGQLGTSDTASALSVAEGGSSSKTGLYELLSTVQGWEASLGGTGGAIQTQMYGSPGLVLYQQGLKALLPGADAALATANTNNQNANASALLSLEEQKNTQLAETLALSQAQYKVLEQLPPFGGSFAMGGIVPGPVGAARMVEAHGGETISPPGSGGGSTAHYVIVEDGAVDPNKIRVIAGDEYEKRGRKTARRVSRGLPSRGGGAITTRS